VVGWRGGGLSSLYSGAVLRSNTGIADAEFLEGQKAKRSSPILRCEPSLWKLEDRWGTDACSKRWLLEGDTEEWGDESVGRVRGAAGGVGNAADWGGWLG
jgi:hypothetical protein